jgi:uncharacterized protein YcbK (DUF882 family)
MVDRKKFEIPFLNGMKISEVFCPCCGHLLLRKSLYDLLTRIVGAVPPGTLHINSCYRCPVHNKEVGGEPHSQHMTGEAADIRIDGLSIDAIMQIAESCGAVRIGQYNTFVHVGSADVFIDGVQYPRRWRK